MTWASPENTKIGESVLVPIQGEFMSDEQICLEYEVVLALRCKVKPEDQIVGTGQPALPEYLPFNDQMAFKKDV